MNHNDTQQTEFNRRDFLKGGSMATMMALLGGVPLLAAEAPAESKPVGSRLKLAVIGCGPWGRELITTLGRVEQAELVAVCDTYPVAIRRGGKLAPTAAQESDYTKILENKAIQAVIIATPSHLHKDVALAALKAGKHVYCEAPLAHTVEDARVIALAAKAASKQVFQTGLQARADKQRQFVQNFVRSGAIGQPVMARAQWNKKNSWRTPGGDAEREKANNWRLYKETSPGLVGEIGIHQLDMGQWFINRRPVAVTGFGAYQYWNKDRDDDRTVPDTAQAVLEFEGGVQMIYNTTLANSFDASYEVYYGNDAAIMFREEIDTTKAWLFKEVDSPLLGWEVYASKESFYKETGIKLMVDASKSGKQVNADAQAGGTNAPPAAVAGQPAPATPPPAPVADKTPLWWSLDHFVRNTADIEDAVKNYKDIFGDDLSGLADELAKVNRRAAAGYLEGYHATVTALKANEAVVTGQRIILKPEWYELT